MSLLGITTKVYSTPIILDTRATNYKEFSFAIKKGKQFRDLFNTNFGDTNSRKIILLNNETLVNAFSHQRSEKICYTLHKLYSNKFPNLAKVVEER